MNLVIAGRRLGWLAVMTALPGCSNLSQLPWPFRTPPAESATTPQPHGSARPTSRSEKIAVSIQQAPFTVEFRAPERIESEAPKIMEESIKAGALFGGIPLFACVVTYACPPDALLAGTALLVAGTAAGILVGAGRVIAGGKLRSPSQPPALAADEIEASAPAIRSAAAEFLAGSALYRCMLPNIPPSGTDANPLQWTHEERTADLVAVAEPGFPSPFPPNGHGRLIALGYDYLIEGFVSRVAILPAGDPGQSGREIPASLLVEAGFRFLGAASGRREEQHLHWRSEPRTLQAWRTRNGALLAEALRQACDSLAVQSREAAERLWRGRP